MKVKLTENKDKFRELVLYISQQCASDPTFGSTKLNKILYFSDFIQYGRAGKSITGFVYQKLPKGPAPKRLLPIRDEMIEEGILGFQEIPLKGGYTQKRTVNLRAPNLKLFTGDEISLVDSVISGFKNFSAEVISEVSHQMVGWAIARDGEEIPYSTTFLSDEPLSDIEIKRGKEIARRISTSR